MPPELRYSSKNERQQFNKRSETVVSNAERFDSEVWEKERDSLSDEITRALQTNELSDDHAFELVCLMTRYSLKDGLALAKKIQLDAVSVADLLREYGGKQELQQKLVEGKPLKERLLQFLDYRRASPLGFATEEHASWRDREKKADEFLQSAGRFVGNDTDLELKVKILLRREGDSDPNKIGGSGIGALHFEQLDEKGLALKERIDRLYEPFYGTLQPEGIGRPKKMTELSPTVNEATQYLDEWREIAATQPVFFVPIQEWLIKRLLNVGVVMDGLQWPNVEVESAVVPGKKLPLPNAIQEYVKASQNGDMDHDWALAELFIEPANDRKTTVPLERLTENLKLLGIDPTQLDVQGVIKRNSVTKLEVTFKIRCRMYAEALKAERQQLEQKQATLKARKADTSTNEYKLRTTRELEETFAKLAKGEMDLDTIKKISSSTTRPWYSSGLMDRNFISTKQSKGVIDVMRRLTSTEAREVRPAKYDHFSKTELEEIFQQVFPTIDITELKERRAQNMAEQDVTVRSYQPQIWDATSYFDPEDASYGIDGDPKDPYPRELMKISRPVDAILVTGVYDTRDEEEGAWKATRSTVDTVSPTDLPRTTAIFQLEAKIGMVLPIALHAIGEPHVIGMTDKGKQVPVVVGKDEMGRVIVKSFPADVKRIAYSQEVPDLLPGVTDVSERNYDTWFAQQTQDKQNKERQTPDQAFRLLPNDCKRFVEEIRRLPPAERVRNIEQFVRTIGYYDFKNGETQGERVGKPLKIRWELMRQRMKLFQAESPKDTALAAKKIAGVCVDFQELTTLLLRSAGCIAGKLSALRVHQEATVTSHDAHALSYVEWPTENGGCMRIPVDGTPGGTNPEEMKDLARIQEPTQSVRADLLEAHRFEQGMDEEEHEKNGVVEKGQKIPLASDNEKTWMSIKTGPTPTEEPEKKKGPRSLTKERMTKYLETSLSPQETHALYRVVSWMAYSPALDELSRLGRVPAALSQEGQLKMEIAEIYTDSLNDSTSQYHSNEPTSIVRDWEYAYHKLRASKYTPKDLATLVTDALPRATDPKSRRDRSINYLAKIVSS